MAAIDLKRVPRWAWVVAGLVAIGAYWYLKHRSTSLAQATPSSTDANPVDTASLGGTPGADTSGSGGASGDSGGADYSSLLADQAAQQQQFLNDFLANQQGQSSAGISPVDWLAFTEQLLARIGAPSPQPDNSVVPHSEAPTPHAVAPLAAAGFPTGGTGLATQTAGGTVFTFTPAQVAQINASPNALRTIASDHPTVQSAATGIHYYTYKKDVPLKKGQTLHFTAGRGYYAA